MYFDKGKWNWRKNDKLFLIQLAIDVVQSARVKRIHQVYAVYNLDTLDKRLLLTKYVTVWSALNYQQDGVYLMNRIAIDLDIYLPLYYIRSLLHLPLKLEHEML